MVKVKRRVKLPLTYCFRSCLLTVNNACSSAYMVLHWCKQLCLPVSIDIWVCICVCVCCRSSLQQQSSSGTLTLVCLCLPHWMAAAAHGGFFLLFLWMSKHALHFNAATDTWPKHLSQHRALPPHEVVCSFVLIKEAEDCQVAHPLIHNPSNQHVSL